MTPILKRRPATRIIHSESPEVYGKGRGLTPVLEEELEDDQDKNENAGKVRKVGKAISRPGPARLSKFERDADRRPEPG